MRRLQHAEIRSSVHVVAGRWLCSSQQAGSMQHLPTIAQPTAPGQVHAPGWCGRPRLASSAPHPTLSSQGRCTCGARQGAARLVSPSTAQPHMQEQPSGGTAALTQRILEVAAGYRVCGQLCSIVCVLELLGKAGADLRARLQKRGGHEWGGGVPAAAGLPAQPRRGFADYSATVPSLPAGPAGAGQRWGLCSQHAIQADWAGAPQPNAQRLLLLRRPAASSRAS